MTTAEMIATSKVMSRDSFVSIRDLQKSPTKSLSGDGEIKFIMNNGKPMGVYLDYTQWEDLLEDMEAMGSKEYINMIAESRKGNNIPAEDVWKELGI